MIRQLAILAVAAIYLTASATATVTLDETDIPKAEKTLSQLLKHKFDIKLVDEGLHKIVLDFDEEKIISKYDEKHQGDVRELFHRYKTGMLLPRGELFSPQYPHLTEQAGLLFKVLYFAPNLWTFILISLWAYLHMNEYMFIVVFQTAMIQRPDTNTIPMPHPYEIFPEHFLGSKEMKQIMDYKLSLHNIGNAESHGFTVIANYTNEFPLDPYDPENQLTYFREDISLNTWFYYINLFLPIWMSQKEFPNWGVKNRGEMYLWINKFLLNIYNLQRMSLRMGKMEPINWEQPIATGYLPSMSHFDGQHFPQRKPWSVIPRELYGIMERTKKYEGRLFEVADTGFYKTKSGELKNITTPEGRNIFGNIIQGNYDSPNHQYYGSFDSTSKRVLGFGPISFESNYIVPSVLDLFSTSLRDPIFYSIAQEIEEMSDSLQEQSGPYPDEELLFEGAIIESVELVGKKLYTYFEKIDTLLEEFWWSNRQKVVKIKARQLRLNNKPFTFKIVINAPKETTAGISIFFGPPTSGELPMSELWNRYYQFDYFVQDLKQGENTIERKSTDAPWYAGDYEPTRSFNGSLAGAERVEFERQRFGFPSRLILPRGWPEGMPFGIFVFAHAAHKTEKENTMKSIYERYDKKPLGFPLDKPLLNYTLPNMYLLETKVILRDDRSINLTNA